MIRKLIHKLFYNPYQIVKKESSVKIGTSSILTKAFEIDFRTKNKPLVTIGHDNFLACKLVFESSHGYISIGDKCFINANTKIISKQSIIIGNFVTISFGVTIYDHDSHSLYSKYRREDIEQQLLDYRNGRSFVENKNWSTVNSSPVVIEDDVWIGMNVTILKGVTIGKGAVIAAGSVVTKNINNNAVVAGNPAVVVKNLD